MSYMLDEFIVALLAIGIVFILVSVKDYIRKLFRRIGGRLNVVSKMR